jgi:uncharacterized protein (DUF1499 family)
MGEHAPMRFLLLVSMLGTVAMTAARQDLACPGTPNCVSTEATLESQQMASVPFADAPEAAQARARTALLQEPRTRIVRDEPGVLEAESKSFLFRFVDDVRVVIDVDARVFRFRSASRVGRSDLGVNRKRMARVSVRLTTGAGR